MQHPYITAGLVAQRHEDLVRQAQARRSVKIGKAETARPGAAAGHGHVSLARRLRHALRISAAC